MTLVEVLTLALALAGLVLLVALFIWAAVRDWRAWRGHSDEGEP